VNDIRLTVFDPANLNLKNSSVGPRNNFSFRNCSSKAFLRYRRLKYHKINVAIVLP